MLEKFQEISKMESFKKMRENELQNYIGDKGLKVVSEDPMFEAVVTWVRHDVKNRKSSFEKLILCQTVTLQCSPRFLAEVVGQEPLMKMGNCLEYLANALYHHVPSHLGQRGTAREGYLSGGDTLIAIYQEQYWAMKDDGEDWFHQGYHNGGERYKLAVLV